MIDKEYKFLCEDLIKKFGYEPLPKFNKEKIIDIMTSDKKATDEYIKYILPNSYATVTEHSFTPDELKEMI
jgi:3-dehydroquinate synthetase